MPTFSPGCHLVPRWRTMMLPARTRWPPVFLTPRRCPAESRPLREEPPAFLCAISDSLFLRLGGGLLRRGLRLGRRLLRRRLCFSLLRFRLLLGLLRLRLRRGLLFRFQRGLRRLLAVGQDLGDAERSQKLAMTLLAAVIRAPLLLEDDDLVAPPLRDDLGRDHGPGDGRAPGFGTALAAEQDDLGKLDDIAGLASDLLDFNNVVWRHAILLAACANDREHDRFRPSSWLEGPAPIGARAARRPHEPRNIEANIYKSIGPFPGDAEPLSARSAAL